MLKQDKMKKIIFLFFTLSFYSSVIAQSDSLSNNQPLLNIFKFNFFSPLLGHSMFSYEREIKPNRSREFSLSIIGAGENMNKFYDFQTDNTIYQERQIGASLGYGYRFYMPRKSAYKNNKKVPSLTGFYFKPTVYGNIFVDDPTLYNGTVLERDVVLSAAVLMESGWQAIIGKVFSIDVYGGFGYGFVNIDYDSFTNQNRINPAFGTNKNSNSYTFKRFGRTVGLALSGGFKVGFVSKSKINSRK